MKWGLLFCLKSRSLDSVVISNHLKPALSINGFESNRKTLTFNLEADGK